MAEFEDLMQRIVGSEEDRTTLLTIAGRYPALKSAVMAQEDYSRSMNENKSKLEKLGEWERWKGQAWDDQAGTTKAEALTRQQLAAAEQRLREIEATGGDQVNFDEVMTELGKRGVMTQTEFDAKVKPTLLDRNTYSEDVVKRLNQQGAIFENIFAQTLPLMQTHARDFGGEILQPKQLLQYMVDNKLDSVDSAYQKMYEPRLNELRQKRDLEKEQQIRADERSKALLERAQSAEGRGIPVDNAGGPRQYGHLEASKLAAAKKSDAGEIPDKVELGSGLVSQMYAEKFAKEKNSAAQA